MLVLLLFFEFCVIFDCRNVFFMSIYDPLKSMQLCVEHCPSKKLSDSSEIMDYAKQYVSLCQYDIPPEDYPGQKFHQTGPCPRLPVHKRLAFMVLLVT